MTIHVLITLIFIIGPYITNNPIYLLLLLFGYFLVFFQFSMTDGICILTYFENIFSDSKTLKNNYKYGYFIRSFSKYSGFEEKVSEKIFFILPFINFSVTVFKLLNIYKKCIPKNIL